MRLYSAGFRLARRLLGGVEWRGYVTQALSGIQYCIPQKHEEIVRYLWKGDDREAYVRMWKGRAVAFVAAHGY
jgi:hypothetical protein